MYSEIENYLEVSYKKLKQGQFTVGECEEILSEQKTLLKIGLINTEEYGIWSCKFQNIYSKGTDAIVLSARGRNCLRRANIDTCGKLRCRILNGSSDGGITKLRNLGEKTVREIIVGAVQSGLISDTELFEAPWSLGYLNKVQMWLKEAGLLNE